MSEWDTIKRLARKSFDEIMTELNNSQVDEDDLAEDSDFLLESYLHLRG